MRINKYVAQASGLSRRSADVAISAGRVRVNNQPTVLGQTVKVGDRVTLDGHIINLPPIMTTLLLNKPTGYVCSREGQGSKTIYQLLPKKYRALKTVGRLDKDSSGLLVLTDDGNLAYHLTHPSFNKQKIYIVQLNRSVLVKDEPKFRQGIKVDTYISRLSISPVTDMTYRVSMSEGHNRQIRRTFAALGYEVISLHRIQFGEYTLGDLKLGEFCETVNRI